LTNLRDRGERREHVIGAHKDGTGPRTAEGLARSRRARWKHGLYSAETRAEQKLARALLQQSRELLKRLQRLLGVLWESPFFQ
jgi:hypothetical protein